MTAAADLYRRAAEARARGDETLARLLERLAEQREQDDDIELVRQLWPGCEVRECAKQ